MSFHRTCSFPGGAGRPRPRWTQTVAGTDPLANGQTTGYAERSRDRGGSSGSRSDALGNPSEVSAGSRSTTVNTARDGAMTAHEAAPHGPSHSPLMAAQAPVAEASGAASTQTTTTARINTVRSALRISPSDHNTARLVRDSPRDQVQ